MALSLTPSYTLTAPMFISSRLMPAILVGNATLSAEAQMVEDGERVHFRFHLDVPGLGSWTSGDSFVTVCATTWTVAAAKALECFCDASDSEESATTLRAMPDKFESWATSCNDSFFFAGENLRVWLEDND